MMLLETLEVATDELTAAKLKAQSLLTDFGLECEYAEMDGEPTQPNSLNRNASNSSQHS